LTASARITVDLRELSGRCEASLRTIYPLVRVSGVEALTGGASSFTFRVTFDGAPSGMQSVVAKVAPPGLPAVGNRDVLRQARLLGVLEADGRVPVPSVVCDLARTAAGQPPGFVMTFVPGDSYEPNMDGPSPLTPTAGEISSRMTHAVRILAQLHSIDPAVLQAPAEPTVSLVDEVSRWARAFETVEPEFRVGADELRDLLLSTTPTPATPRLSHGDYRLGNMLADHDCIRAVIDWEIWSVSDPRVDLAWFLMLVEPSSQPLAVWKAPGMPTETEVIDAYERSVGAPVAAINWFEALVRYKQAAISALVVKNNRRRARPDPSIERHAANPLPSLAGGLRRLRQAT
jgi:aminoglycoside phosphotransferase (APT) family kinase protein